MPCDTHENEQRSQFVFCVSHSCLLSFVCFLNSYVHVQN